MSVAGPSQGARPLPGEGVREDRAAGKPGGGRSSSAAGPSLGADDRRAAPRSSGPPGGGEQRSPRGDHTPLPAEGGRDAARAASLGEGAS